MHNGVEVKGETGRRQRSAEEVLVRLPRVTARLEEAMARLCGLTTGTDRPMVLRAIGELSMSKFMLERVRAEIEFEADGNRAGGGDSV